MRNRVYPMSAFIRILSTLSILSGVLLSGLQAHAETPSTPIAPLQAAASPSGGTRDFYQVLDEVLGDFEFDLKNGNVNGLKDLSIRNLALSENVPPSFKAHLELLITETILKNTKTRVIQCLPCRARKTSLDGDQIVIKSPETDPMELTRIAKATGIARFMDVAFSFEPTGIVMSMTITDPETDSILWSRSYNSENSRSAAFKRGVDYTQIDSAHRATEYAPLVQSRLIIYYLVQPNHPSPTGNLALGYRMMERYDNRKKEVGFEANYMTNASTIVNRSAAVSTDLYASFGFNLTLVFLHAWNFIGEEENYNLLRGSLLLGIGGTYASGYLGGLVRAGYEWRLGKHFATGINLGYRPASTSFLGGQATITGLEYGLGVSVLF
ncbi:MAG: hypothetical protein ACO3A2_08780 [Bdellovibrionia bacterium]